MNNRAITGEDLCVRRVFEGKFAKRSGDAMTVSKEQILRELREMVPLAVEALHEMLQNPRTPPVVRKQLIELALKYGVNEKSTLALQDT